MGKLKTPFTCTRAVVNSYRRNRRSAIIFLDVGFEGRFISGKRLRVEAGARGV